MYTPRGTLDRDTVIARYGKMVRRVAVQMASRLPSSIDLDDLVQAGLIGLVDAVSRYDATVGVQFDTFAMQRVRGAMLDELRNADWMPRSVRRSQRNIEAAIHAVEQRMQRPATEREIADELKMSLEDYQRLLSSAKGAQLLYFEDSAVEEEGESRLEQSLKRPTSRHQPSSGSCSMASISTVSVLPILRASRASLMPCCTSMKRAARSSRTSSGSGSGSSLALAPSTGE